MSRSITEQIKKCNTEIARLKKLVPGLMCSDDMMTDRGRPYLLCGITDEGCSWFSLCSQTEEPELIASRLLDGLIELMNRLHKNVEALEEIVNGN